MIIAEWKPIAELVDMIRGHKKIMVAGCATCVGECAAGGEREVKTLAPALELAMKKDGHPIEVVTATLERQCEWEFVEEIAKKVSEVDAIVSLACGIGMQALSERYADTPVLPGVNTTSLAIRQEPGVWSARCAACGDCVLDETFGYCPVARCAKSLMNGPCGGTRNEGKCEIDPDIDCVWYLIANKAQKLGALDKLAEVRKPKNWSNSQHGGPKRMVREDLR